MAGPRPSIWDDGCPPPRAAYPGISDGPPSNIPLFGLAPGGVYRASPVARTAGALLPHRFTLTPDSAGRFVFCGTFPRVTPGGRYPPPCPVEPGLSSRRLLLRAAAQPTPVDVFILLRGSLYNRRQTTGVFVNSSYRRWRDWRRHRPPCSDRGVHGAPRWSLSSWQFPSPDHTRA